MNKILPSDFHIHTNFSADSSEDIEKIIKAAINLNMKHICITDHIDLDYWSDGLLYEFDKEEYFQCLLNKQELYKNQIDLRIGVETGLEPDKSERLNEFLQDTRFDFVIGSSHLVNKQDPYYPEYFVGKTDQDAFHEYFESIVENLKFCTNFDVYGHLDYVVRYSPNKNENYSYELFSEILDEIIKSLITLGKGIEVNTGGFRSGLRTTNPCIDVIRRYHELGGDIITIGSDAHKVTDLGANFLDAVDILKACDIKYYTVFKNRKPQFIHL